MSFTTVPNGGIMMDDGLDKLRTGAVRSCIAGTKLTSEMADYLEALERRYLDMIHQQHIQSAKEVGWSRFSPEAAA